MRLHVLMAIQERIGNPFIDKSSYVLSKQGLILIWLVVTGTLFGSFFPSYWEFPSIPTDELTPPVIVSKAMFTY